MVVGIGNTLRSDDGVGPFVIDLLRAARPGWLELRTTHTLLPEFAVELPGYEAVVFVDADVQAHEVTFQPVAMEASDRLHGVAPTRVVQLARGLGFDGEA
jgi:hydrogenase maturation protease